VKTPLKLEYQVVLLHRSLFS